MDDNKIANDSKQEEIKIKIIEKGLRQKMKDADRKAIIREAAEEAFEKYDDVFKKLSKS